jgi:uncharacterized DUF497 family protein
MKPARHVEILPAVAPRCENPDVRSYLEIFDPEHSETEDRFIAIGLIGRGLIVVVWTQSEEDTTHIISARFATKREQKLYESYKGRRND